MVETDGERSRDLLIANQALSQLSYDPKIKSRAEFATTVATAAPDRVAFASTFRCATGILPGYRRLVEPMGIQPTTSRVRGGRSGAELRPQMNSPDAGYHPTQSQT